MEEINNMTLAQIKLHSVETASLKLSEQQQMISSIALGAQGTKESIKTAIEKLSSAQESLRTPPAPRIVRVPKRPRRVIGSATKIVNGEL